MHSPLPLQMLTTPDQLIPSDIRWEPNATPPQFTNNEDSVIEPGTHVRIKIINMRSDIGEMYAVGTIKEDYLGYVKEFALELLALHRRTLTCV